MSDSTSKLVFVGELGAGKTTAVRTLSDVEPVGTEMPLAAAEARDGKTHTTVALDYSSIDLDGGDMLHVYGVPGQKHLDFMWPIVCDGAIGIVVLADARRENALDATLDLLGEFTRLAPQANFAVGATHTDRNNRFDLTRFRDALYEAGHRLPVLRVDARDRSQVEFLVRSLLSYREVGATLAAN